MPLGKIKTKKIITLLKRIENFTLIWAARAEFNMANNTTINLPAIKFIQEQLNDIKELIK